MGKLEFSEQKEGSEKDSTLHHELKPESLSYLTSYHGQDVEVWARTKSWLHRGEHTEEDMTDSVTHAFGRLIEASAKDITLEIKTGDIDYGSKINSVIPTGSKQKFPFYRHTYRERHFAEERGITQLSIGEHTFQLRRVPSQERGQVSA